MTRPVQLRVSSRKELATLFDLRHLSQPGQFIKINGPCPEHYKLVDLINHSTMRTIAIGRTVEEQLEPGDVLLGVNIGWYVNPDWSERVQEFYTDLYVTEGGDHLLPIDQMNVMIDTLAKAYPPPAGAVKDTACWVVYIKDDQLRLSLNTWYKQCPAS